MLFLDKTFYFQNHTNDERDVIIYFSRNFSVYGLLHIQLFFHFCKIVSERYLNSKLNGKEMETVRY
jgi:hypothetical protein